MRTLNAGLDSLRRTPAALLPMTIEGLVVAAFFLAGRMPGGGGGAAAGAAFPLDVFFDVKQAVASSPSWLWFAAALMVSALGRGTILALTIWLADDRREDASILLARCAALGARAALFLFPAASMFFIGVATRYAPFVFFAALLALVAVPGLSGRAVTVTGGVGAGSKKGGPGISGVLAYGYLIAASGAAFSVLANHGTWAPAVFVALMGPVHGVVLLGWRARAKEPERTRRVTLAVTLALALGLALNSFLDRSLRSPAPWNLSTKGQLVLLSGADSASDRGSLYGFDPRALGFPIGESTLLSYRSDGPYSPEDTHKDLDRVARLVGAQLEDLDEPLLLLGHSQASQILDRMIVDGRTLPEAVAVISPPVSYPPSVQIPPPGEDSPGRVGGDTARAFAGLLDSVGLQPFDVDAPASPTNLAAIDLAEEPIPRLSVWALADSVWLDGDWRHGGVNIVTMTDHVGAINDPASIEAIRDFFHGRVVTGDEASWRGFVVSSLRYVFEPWRPQ